MQRCIAFVLIGSGLLGGWLSTAGAVEPWTDERLANREGLILWLDAARQDRAYEAHGLPAVPPGGPLAVWFDGAAGRRLVQRVRDASPRLQLAGGRGAVHFDGQDDRLELAGFDQALEQFTLFLYASPRANAGHFPGLIAFNETARRDYTSGFNLDLGPRPTERFETLNIEGKGFAGASDLLSTTFPMGTFHTIEVRVGQGQDGVALRVDGRPQGTRNRPPGTIVANELTVGARYYSNSGGPSFIQDFFDGAIAEVLVYNRLLTDSEAVGVRDYLGRKYSVLPESLAPQAGNAGRADWRVATPPPVQMLVPGFRVRELPLELTNINNVKYRHDGKLVALAYDGKIHVLSDHDGDGLEDHATTFWDNPRADRSPIGMDLLPAGDPRGNGVLVASKAKCALIVDSDGDDRADREIIVAEGWPELKHAVGALGVALAKDGSVYFGTGTASYTAAYQVDASGRSRYDLKSELGTILRVAPDFRSRIIVATGIRYPVALRFNREGDLFATDQEGATWLANGNPFDELLHIQKGRHYGFPPRHSRYLPGVIDEPSVFDYKPQHQSTCGLNFNDPVVGGAGFGPAGWNGDALVCGYSRGKLFRTKLVKTPAGYVGQSALLAVLNRLTVDACVSPRGDLVVSTHSGGPDWGSGPTGKGTLYNVAYADHEHPQPMMAWAASPREVRVAFDRPIDPALLRNATQNTSITSGRSVAAGDRFESLRPGYAVVMAQLGEPRTPLAVHAVQLSSDRRSLILATDPQIEAVAYALTLPGMGRPPRGRSAEVSRELPQEPAIDLAYGLTGVQAEWRSGEDDAAWSGWLPHLDLAVARAFTAGCTEHDRLWPLLRRRGTLTLTTQLDLKNLLRPAVQPGSQVDDVLPPERPTLTLESGNPIEVNTPSTQLQPFRDASSVPASDPRSTRVSIAVPEPGEPLRLEVVLTTGTAADRPPSLNLSYRTSEDPRPRALPLERVLLPWVQASHPAQRDTAWSPPPELAGGSWAAGRSLFHGEVARCGECHAVRGRGGSIGPDLSNLAHRDYVSVLRDIREPSFAINPDHVTYSLALRDGRVLAGTLRTEGDTLRIGDSQGRETRLARGEVEALQAQPVSTMPEGLVTLLGAARLKDLLTFLLTPELSPAPIHREGAPPPHTRAELDAVLKATRPEGGAPAGPVNPLRPLHITLVDGPKDHGVDEHDYPLWQERWGALLGRAEGVAVSTAHGWPAAEDFARSDVMAWYSANPGWSAEKGALLDAFLARGGGIVLLHYAVNGQKAPAELAQRIGLAWQGGRSKFRHGPLDLAFTAPAHPITAGFRGLHLEDESYWQLVGDPPAADSGVQVLATAVEEGTPRPLLWTRQAGKGRVFVSIPGHYTWTFDDPLFRTLILRGIAWTAGEPVERFEALIPQGARLAAEPAGAP